MNKALAPDELLAGAKNLLGALKQKESPLIILIDDDDNDAFLFRHALTEASVSVEFMRFKDGAQALRYFQGQDCFSDRLRFPLPNLTILDFHLTRGSGLEILEYIRSCPHLAELVVVGLTASCDQNDACQAQLLRIDDYIPKPKAMGGMKEIVRSIKAAWLDKLWDN